MSFATETVGSIESDKIEPYLIITLFEEIAMIGTGIPPGFVERL